MASNRLAKVVITLDGSRVEVGLDKIRQKTQEVVAKMQTLVNAGKQNTKEYKECVKALNTLHKAETDVASVQQRINTYMKELGNVATTDLRRAYREGIQLREGFKGTDKELQKLNHDLAAMKAQIDKNTGSTTALTKAQMGFVGSLKTTLKNLVAYAGVFALFNQIKGAIISVGKKNLEFSDELTNIRKVSQLAEEDINKLANSLAKIDTRSSVHELNNLAYAGAKLGMQEHGGVAALESFVKAADKVNVALKEDLGDDALVAMSKLVEVMGLIPKMGIEKSMDAAGSAIFTLSTSSTATGANIIEFSKRLMGLANVSHVTTAELLALGSASDAMGLMPEVSSTAFNKVFTNIQSNTAAIEKSLDFTKGTLQELINDGKTMEAITTVFTKMHGMSMAELKGRGVFQALGSDGARLNNVMTTMADRVDMLTAHLEMSNKAFEEGTAVQKEYEMQMESAQGYMERSANLWEKALVNPEGVDAMKEFAKAWYNLSQTLSTSTLYMGQIKLTLKGLITAMEAIITLAPFLIDFFMLKGVVQGIKYLNSMRLAFLANKAAIEGMTEAQLAANKAMKANVYIAIAAAVITLGQYIYELSVKTDDAEKAQERLNGALSEGAVEAQREVGHLNNVIKALDSAKLSQEGREKVIADFNQKYGQYINALGIEIKTVDDLRKNYDALAGAIRRAAYERVKDKFKEQELEPLIKASIEAGADLQKGGNAQTNAISVHDAEQAVSNFSKAIQTLTAKNLKKFRETYKQELQAIGLDPEKATVDQIKAKSTPADTRKIFNRSVQNGPRSLNEYLMNLIDKGEIKSAADAYKNIIMKEFSEGAKFGAEFDENLNYVVGQRVVNGVKVGTPVTKGTGAVGGEKSSAFNKKLYENVEKFVDAYLAVKNRGDEIDSAFDPYIRVPEPQGDNKIKPYEGGGGDDKKAANDAKAAARKELKDAETETNAIIAKIEEWYTLQQNVITESYNDGKITEQQMTSVNQQLEQAKNTALAAARRSLSGQDTQTWQKVKTDMDALMLDQGEWSRELLDAIVNTDMDALRNALMKFDGKKSLEQWGFTSTAFRDGLNKNASKNEAKAQEIDAKAKKQVETFLLQYDFINQAYKSFSDQLVNLGILTETAQQMAKKMADADNPEVLYSQKDFRADQQRQEQSRRDALTAFLKQGSRPYSVDMNNASQLQDWLRELTGAEFDGIGAQGMELKFHSWAEAFRDDFTLWIKDADKYKTSIQEFFMSLMTAEDNYYKKRKEAYNNAKTHLDQSMQAAGWTDQYDEAQTELSGISSLRKITGEGENLWQQHGLQDTIAEDPEIKAIQLRIAMRQKEFEEAKALGESQQLIAEKQNEVLAAQADLAEQVGNSIANRISHLRELSAPLEEFGEDVGQKLGDALFGLQSTSDTWNQITKKMILSVSKMTLQMASQYLQQKLQQALTNKAIEAQEMMHQATMQSIAIAGGTARVAAEQVTNTQLLTATEIADRLRIAKEARVAAIMAAFGVSEGAAKTIAALGFWGIPLIGVITSVLMGLLSSALSTAGSESESASSSTAAATPKTKLVSGMLTYDKGNVDKFAGRRKLYDDGETQVYGRRRYLGEDGKVYTATAEPAPKDGLVTHPIATTVQGQPALVAEKGPEIVLGRETTKAIMMNEPELIKYLANYQQHGGSQGYSTARGLAAYDSGNVQSVAATQPSDLSPRPSDSAERQALINRLDRSDALMEQVLYFLQNPIAPEIAMYDTGGKKGLHTKIKQADKFMARYGG